MNEILTNLIQKEKRRQLAYSIGAAAIIAILILSISFFIDYFGPPLSIDGPNDDDNNDDNGDPNGDDPSLGGYVLSLSGILNSEFMEDGIVRFVIAGNITPAIHPRLIYSEVTPDIGGASWDVDAWVLNATTLDPFTAYQDSFVFTNTQMVITHNTFLNALNQTEEVNETDIPQNGGSVPNLLFYEVYLEDGSGYEFVWAGFQDVDIMIVSHFDWTGPVTSTAGSSLTVDQYNRGPVTEKHYISPLTAFDPFISQLQSLYGSILDV